jgi:hypothetical protein
MKSVFLPVVCEQLLSFGIECLKADVQVPTVNDLIFDFLLIPFLSPIAIV